MVVTILQMQGNDVGKEDRTPNLGRLLEIQG
jgi:hypothetical protein